MTIFSFFLGDWYEMMFHFGINLFFNSLIIAIVLRLRKERSTYVFTFFLVSIVIFFLCFSLKKFDLNLGLALGLFAIFGIIRYRTESLKANEMTYLFVTIGISLINALANEQMSLTEVLTINIIIVLAVFVSEKLILKQNIPLSKEELPSANLKMSVVLPHDTSTNVQNMERHFFSLEKNLAIKIHHYQVSKVDYTTQLFHVNLYYTTEE